MASVLFVDSTLVRAGAENLRLFACRGLSRRGWKVDVAVLGEPGDVAEQIETEGVAVVHRLRCGDSVRSLAPSRALAKLMSRLMPDVLVSARLDASLHAGLARAARLPWRRPRWVIEAHSTDDWMRLPHEWLWRRLLHRADLSTGCSQPVVDKLRRRFEVPESRATLLLGGADLSGLGQYARAQARAFFGIPDTAKVVGSVGSLRDAKRYDRILEAAATLEREGRQIWVLLSSHGPLKPNLERRARELGIADRVVFGPKVGPREIARQYAALDVFVLPSEYEGLGLVLPEAMALGVPVIGSDVGGIPSVVEHGVTGWIFERNDIPALARHLATALDGGPEVEAIVERARTRAWEVFDAERYGRDVVSLYEGLG